MWNSLLGKDGSSFLFEIMRMSVLLSILIPQIFKDFLWILSFGRFSWSFIRSFTAMTFFSKSRDRDVLFKLVFHWWRQFRFIRNPEKFSAKNVIPLLFKFNFLSFKCLLGSILLYVKGMKYSFPYTVGIADDSLRLLCCSIFQALEQC